MRLRELLIDPICSVRPDHSLTKHPEGSALASIDAWYHDKDFQPSAVSPESLDVVDAHVERCFEASVKSLETVESKADWMMTLNAGLVGVGLLQLDLLRQNRFSVLLFVLSSVCALVGVWVCIRAKLPGAVASPMDPEEAYDLAETEQTHFESNKDAYPDMPRADHAVRSILCRSKVTAIVGLQQLVIWKCDLIHCAKLWLLISAGLLVSSAAVAICWPRTADPIREGAGIVDEQAVVAVEF